MKGKPGRSRVLDSFGIVETRGQADVFVVGPEGLSEVLTELNGLMVAWAEMPEAVRQTVSGPVKALPASRVELARGRDPTELALTIHAGPMQLVYLCPLEGFVPEALKLLKQVQPIEPPERH